MAFNFNCLGFHYDTTPVYRRRRSKFTFAKEHAERATDNFQLFNNILLTHSVPENRRNCSIACSKATSQKRSENYSMEKSPHLWVKKMSAGSVWLARDQCRKLFPRVFSLLYHRQTTLKWLWYRLSIWGQVKNNNDKNKQTKKVSRLRLLHFWPVLIFHMLQKSKNEISQNHLFLFPVKIFPSRLTSCNKLSWNSYIFFIIWY